jgi:hypothetical protein
LIVLQADNAATDVSKTIDLIKVYINSSFLVCELRVVRKSRYGFITDQVEREQSAVA